MEADNPAWVPRACTTACWRRHRNRRDDL